MRLNTPMKWHAALECAEPTVQLQSEYFAPEAAALIAYLQRYSIAVKAHKKGPKTDRGFANGCLQSIRYFEPRVLIDGNLLPETTIIAPIGYRSITSLLYVEIDAYALSRRSWETLAFLDAAVQLLNSYYRFDDLDPDGCPVKPSDPRPFQHPELRP